MSDRTFLSILACLAVVLCVVAVDTVIVFENRNDVTRFTSGRVLTEKVDQLSCQRTLVTRAGLVTFFDAAAKDRMAAERRESDVHQAALDAALVKADLLAASQERSAGCDGAFPDGGSG
ncbi:MAG: hypothetical protein ACLP0J_28185 [Solirubrobacteraceae bacterium]